MSQTEESDLGAEAASCEERAGCSAGEDGRDSRLWRSVVIGEQEHRIDMKSIEPYKRVISHGGIDTFTHFHQVHLDKSNNRIIQQPCKNSSIHEDYTVYV